MNTRWLRPGYSDFFPVASLMKYRLPELWLRIHSLPESKRYPESDEEREVVMDRYTQFGNALIGEGQSCTLVRSRLNVAELESKYRGELSWAPLREIKEDDEDTWYAWCAEAVWCPDQFRDLLLDVAEDRDWGVSFVSHNGHVFAPYDGGADGFSFDPELLTKLREEFQSWLSSRDDGL